MVNLHGGNAQSPRSRIHEVDQSRARASAASVLVDRDLMNVQIRAALVEFVLGTIRDRAVDVADGLASYLRDRHDRVRVLDQRCELLQRKQLGGGRFENVGHRLAVKPLNVGCLTHDRFAIIYRCESNGDHLETPTAMKPQYLPRSWVSPKIFLGKSRIQGRGVFARERIREGEKVMEFGGERISRHQMQSGAYRIRSIWPVERDTFIALPESDPQTSLDEYLNHSCDANTWLEDEVTLVAKRDIAAGEEITLDQGTWNIEDAYIEDGEPCSCGAAECRGMLTEEDWKRADVRARYAGHFHPLIESLDKSRV